ncbi:MAG: hypothetical protein IJ748_04530 [Bacteroidales bacterium]|nr:hypothetical protein [Bacteroidales bacterium]
MIKKYLILFSFSLFVYSIAFSQPPSPRHGSKQNVAVKEGSVVETPETEGPIGTATALLFTLGMGTLAYKLHKKKADR